MATTTGIKFYVKNVGATQASTFSTENVGSIVFDKTAHALFVNGTQYGGNLADATYANNILSIIKADGSSVSLDFSTLAQAASVMKAFDDVNDELDAIETGVGLNTDGTYAANTQANYINDASSFKDADNKLDAAIKAANDRIDLLGGDAVKDVAINGTSITDASDGEVNILVDGTYSSSNKIATQSTVSGAIANLDGSATIASESNGVVTLKAGITETDGVVSNNSGSDITLAKVATTGEAADVSYSGTDSVTGDEPATVEGALDDLYVKVNQAIAAAGVTEFGGKTGAITLGSYLGMGTDANDHKVGVTNVDTDGTSTTATDLATVKTVNDHVLTAIGALDGNITGTPGAGNTVTAFSETDGVVTATFSAISITSSQISDVQNTYSATDEKTISGKGVAAALETLDGSHDVATGAAYTAGDGEHAAYKIDLFDATETDGKVTTNNAAADTIYFSAQPTAANPVVTYNDISGLSGAMHYKGAVSADPTVTAPTGTWTAGDVVTNGNVEYVYDGTNWRVLGDEGSYALKTTTVTGTNGLTGGGALSQNQTISHATQTTGTTTGTAVTSGSVTVVTGITTDSYAHVSSYETTSVTLPTVNDGVLTIQGAASGPITVAPTGSGYTANSSTGETYTITHASAPTTGTPAAIKVAVDSYGHVKAGDAIVASEIGFTAPEGMSADDVQEAIEEVNTKVTNAGITIDGYKGDITTGNGLTDVAANDGSFAVKLDSTNANGLSVGASGIAMAKATGSTFGTVQVTDGNGLSLSNGVVSYTHNTSAITVASKDTDTNVITINGTLTPDASDAITTSNAITLAAVAATGAATNMTVTSATYGGSTATTNLQTALTNLSSAISTSTAVADGNETVVVNDTNATTIATVGGNNIKTKVAFYWEEYN